MINFIQWNCRGLCSNLEELQLLNNDVNASVICLQETFLKPSADFSLEGYVHSHFCKDFGSGRASGGSSVFVRDDVISSNIDIMSQLQVSARLVSLQRTIAFCSIYIPPDYALCLEELENIINQLPKPYILVGDFNAHNPLWGSLKHNARGRVVESFINRN